MMNFPYEEYRDTSLWKTIDDALTQLKENNDFKLTTAQQYLTGYICNELVKSGLIDELIINNSEND